MQEQSALLDSRHVPHALAKINQSSSSSVSSSSSSAGGGGDGFLGGPLLRVPALPNGRLRGGGGPSLDCDGAASFVGCATVEVDFSVSDDPPLSPLSEASASDSVSASDRSGVAGPGTSSSSFCSSAFVFSISTWSLSESSCIAFAALVGALRLELRDGTALRGVSVLADCMASA
jgi:hypothetical protein